MLAGLLTEIGQLDEALRLSQQSLGRQVNIAGAKSAEAVACLRQISDVLFAQNRIPDALKVSAWLLFTSKVRVRERVYPSSTVDETEPVALDGQFLNVNTHSMILARIFSIEKLR